MRLDSRRLAARLRAEQDGAGARPACRCELPWDGGRVCPNVATAADGFCDECRAVLAEYDEWSERESRRGGWL